MTISVIKNVFSDSELYYFNEAVSRLNVPIDQFGNQIKDENADPKVSESLGRLKASRFLDDMPIEIKIKLEEIVSNLLGVNMSLSNSSYAEYSGLYGTPVLPPHVDGDTNEILINFQLSSNTFWDIGLGLQTYRIDDNSAIIFNPNTTIHWRPKKIFNDEEYVRMIFFRFWNKANRKDYSHLPNTSSHEMFKDVVNFRDSLIL
jgi:hypothetical protein